MGVLDGVARSVAGTLIARFGKRVGVVYRRGGTYDPASGTITGAPEATATLSALMGDTQRLQRLGFGEIGEVQAGDLAVDLPARDFEAAFGAGAVPTPADAVVVDGVEYQVKQVKPMWSGEQVAMYTLHIRR
ncbi:MAG TPA: hypothetical protein VF188_00450 [Longimicrobiales bacterium]